MDKKRAGFRYNGYPALFCSFLDLNLYLAMCLFPGRDDFLNTMFIVTGYCLEVILDLTSRIGLIHVPCSDKSQYKHNDTDYAAMPVSQGAGQMFSCSNAVHGFHPSAVFIR